MEGVVWLVWAMNMVSGQVRWDSSHAFFLHCFSSSNVVTRCKSEPGVSCKRRVEISLLWFCVDSFEHRQNERNGCYIGTCRTCGEHARQRVSIAWLAVPDRVPLFFWTATDTDPAAQPLRSLHTNWNIIHDPRELKCLRFFFFFFIWVASVGRDCVPNAKAKIKIFKMIN